MNNVFYHDFSLNQQHCSHTHPPANLLIHAVVVLLHPLSWLRWRRRRQMNYMIYFTGKVYLIHFLRRNAQIRNHRNLHTQSLHTSYLPTTEKEESHQVTEWRCHIKVRNQSDIRNVVANHSLTHSLTHSAIYSVAASPTRPSNFRPSGQLQSCYHSIAS